MTTPGKDGATAAAPMTAKVLKQEAQRMSGLALETLAEIMRGTGQDSAKLAAAREVLDRAHGKPKPAAKPKTKPQAKAAEALTVIVKRFTDITPEDEAEADATEARF
jgi:hypothetical protein